MVEFFGSGKIRRKLHNFYKEKLQRTLTFNVFTCTGKITTNTINNNNNNKKTTV